MIMIFITYFKQIGITVNPDSIVASRYITYIIIKLLLFLTIDYASLHGNIEI